MGLSKRRAGEDEGYVEREWEIEYGLREEREGDILVELTIMFSRACLANQQLRNTGMNRFPREGKITCGRRMRGKQGEGDM